MKTVLLCGLFPSRSMKFMQTLVRHFRVITFRDEMFLQSPNLVAVEDLIGKEPDIDYKQFVWELHRSLRYSENLVQTLFPGSALPEPGSRDFSFLYDLGLFCTFRAAKLRVLFQQIRPDMVVTCADYDAARRVVVLEAKAHGIPTFTIEHGHHSSYPGGPESYQDGAYADAIHISDYVNFDNPLEVEIMEDIQRSFKKTDPCTLLALGTPNDISSDKDLTRAEAVALLGLNPEKKILTLAGSWEGEHLGVFQEHFAVVEHYREFFKLFGGFKDRDAFQVVVKLHPTFAESAFQGARNCILEFAEQAGVTVALITAKQAREIFAATDVMLGLAITSILWDNFVAGKQGILYMSKYSRALFRYPGRFETRNPLFLTEGVKMALNPEDLLKQLSKALDPAEENRFQTIRSALMAKYNVIRRSPEEISENICQWINAFR